MPCGRLTRAAAFPAGRLTRAALRAAAVLAVASAAGCGLVSPSQPRSGLEKQVSNGERISAATRAHSLRRPAASVPASPSAPATAPAPASARRKVPGGEVTAIGDSVMAASAVALKSALPGIYIDAKPCRQVPAGLDVVHRLAASGQLRQVVVVGLGTNYIVTAAQLGRLLRLIGPGRKLVLINTYVPDEWSRQVNATMAGFIRRHRAVVLADWFDTIRHRTGLLWPDHVHPLMPGTSAYARLVYRAVQATRGASGAPPARGI